MEGTITWYNKESPPPKLASGNTSDLVLVYDPKTKMANTDFYIHDKANFFQYKNATHWAYINSPVMITNPEQV
jgi:hypothetical protein